MIESLKLVTLLTYIFFSTAGILQVVSNGESDIPDKDFDWNLQLPKSDMGCDAECYVTTTAFGLASAGICNEDRTCDCTYVTETTLIGLFIRKFGSPSNIDISNAIEAESKLSEAIFKILFENPLQTGTRIKELLRPHLTSHQFEQLYVPYSTPATRMFTDGGRPQKYEIGKYVDEVLPGVIRLWEKELSAIDFETALRTALDELRHDIERRRNLILEIRRVKNESLNSVLAAYLAANELTPVDDLEDISSPNYIAYDIVDGVVNKASEKSSLKKWANWVGKKIKGIITSFCSKSADSNFDLYEQTRFLLPQDVDREALAQKKTPFSEVWKGQGYTIRYSKGDRDEMNLIWVKKSIRVSIRRTLTGDVSQYWNFRTVTVTMSKTTEGDIRQHWDFGKCQYQYHKKDGNGAAPKEKWKGENPNEKLMEKYKEYIHTWCRNNDIFIDPQSCIIYKNQNK